MESISDFFQHNMIVVYFFYGLAFFCLGLVVLIESRRSSSFRLAGALSFLAVFGLIHGIHEWFEMFQRLAADEAVAIPSWLLLNEIRIGLLVISFIFLILFGVSLIFTTRENYRKERLLVYAAAAILVVLWLVSVLLTRWLYQPPHAEFLTSLDILARYILGIPGALLATWAIIIEQRTFRARGLTETGRDLLRAALALLLYGVVGQLFTAPSFLFPATIINSELFLQIFGIPVQLFRGIMAALVAIFVIRALRAFETERQRNLAQANEDRLAAQRQALAIQETARIETEQLNQALQTAVQDLTLLFDLSRTLAQTSGRSAILQEAIDQITASLPRFASGIIVLRQQPGKPLVCAACVGQDECQQDEPCQVARALTRNIEKSAAPVCLTHEQMISLPTDANPMDGILLEVAPESRLGVPLYMEDRIIGSMVLKMQPNVMTVTARDLSLLRTAAGQLSIAIENANRYEEAQAREALRGELLHQVVSVQERERQRIARELHDSTGQALTAIGLGLAGASNSVRSDPELAAAQLTEMKQMSSQALTELRELIHDLRPSLLDDLGLVPALKNQVQAFKTHHAVKVDLTLNGNLRRLPPDIETIIFRIAQEALNNVAKHAGAKQVQVTLTFAAAEVQLLVKDDGTGFQVEDVLDREAQPRRAWGLLGMQERVAAAGGSCHIGAVPGEGTIVDVCIPLLGAVVPEMAALENGD